jgi:hypothetical protein
MTEDNTNTGAVPTQDTRPETPTLDNPQGTEQGVQNTPPVNVQDTPTPQSETTSVQTEPQSDTPPVVTEEPKSDVETNIAERLGKGGEAKEEIGGTAPKAKTPNMIDLNNLTHSMIQDLQDVMSSTPRRKKTKETYNTVELREVGGKVIVEWGDTHLEQKRDDVLQKDVMKLVIPVRFDGEEKFTNILWREEFMQATKVTCRILDMQKKEDPVVVGTTFKRDEDGGTTSQEVEMYDTKVIITLVVAMPDGKEITIDGNFTN